MAQEFHDDQHCAVRLCGHVLRLVRSLAVFAGIFCAFTSPSAYGQATRGKSSSIEIWYGNRRVDEAYERRVEQPERPESLESQRENRQSTPTHEPRFDARPTFDPLPTDSNGSHPNSSESYFNKATTFNQTESVDSLRIRKPLASPNLPDDEVRTSVDRELNHVPVIELPPRPIVPPDQATAHQNNHAATIRDIGQNAGATSQAAQPPNHETAASGESFLGFVCGFLCCLCLVGSSSIIILRKLVGKNGALFRVELVHGHLSGPGTQHDQNETSSANHGEPFANSSRGTIGGTGAHGETFEHKRRQAERRKTEQENAMIEQLYQHNVQLRKRTLD